MKWLNVNQVYYFYMVAKLGSIKEASRHLNLTQPTISAQIKQLEETIGFNLFDRAHRRLIVNKKGALVYGYAETLFKKIDELEFALSLKKSSDRVKFQIGVLQYLSSSFIYDFSLSLWRDKTISVSIKDGPIDYLMKKLDLGECNIIINDSPLSKTLKYKSTFLARDRVVAVCHPKNVGLVKKFPQDLGELPYLRLSNNSTLARDIDYYFEKNKIHTEIFGEVNDAQLKVKLVQMGGCFAVLPLKMVSPYVKSKSLSLLGELPPVAHRLYAIQREDDPHFSLTQKILRNYFKKHSR